MKRNWLLVTALVGLAGFPGAFAGTDLNWVKNGDFQAPGNWSGNLVTEPEDSGKPAAFLQNNAPTWTECDQKIVMPQPPPPAIEISGRLKTENVVRGANDWEVARITVVFCDDKGNRLGDWPAPVAEVEGTKDWDFYSNQYSVPPQTAWVTLGISLGNCTGKAWFSDLRLFAYDYDQKPLPPGQAAHPSRKPPAASRTENWLLNPDFETPGGSDWTQARIAGPGHQSLHCLSFHNEKPSWTLCAQDVSFRGQTPVSVAYSGWLKTQDVRQGQQNWEAARLGIDFRDANGQQLGGWQGSVCAVTGTSDWTYYEKNYAVPPGTALAHVDAGLGNCTGRSWVDDLSLKLLDAKGKPIPITLQTQQVSDTSDWYAFQAPPRLSDTALDLSFLNEKPAGRHGFVAVKGGHFTFADGTRVRFWGTDLVGPNDFPTHEQADEVAAQLARLGVNLIRFHMPDASWMPENNFFDPGSDNTLTLKPEQVEKFDYLVSALKKNGIYFYPDWLVDRKFREGDGVAAWRELEPGAKGVIHFDPRVMELTQKYAQELLGHKNPYTGMALKDDPAYVGNEIVNESSIFSGFGEQKFPEVYWKELQKLYSAWGGHGEITRFNFDWDSQKLVPLANPENAAESLKFLLAEVTKTDGEMKAFQEKLSPHALLSGSNMGLPVLGAIRSDATLDFMDSHAYWDHPQIWNVAGGWVNVGHAPMNNNSQLLSPFKGSLVFGLSQDAVEGKPLIITEWNDCFPNEYRLEGPVLMAAYGSLQDWDGMLQFDHGLDLPGKVKMTNFDINNRVDDQPLFQAGALLFRLGYLQASPVTVVEPLSDADVLDNGMKSDWLFDHPWLPYAVRVMKRFTGKRQDAAQGAGMAVRFFHENEKRVESSTGEETLDYGKGILRIDSPCVQGYTGAIGTGETLKTSGLEMTLAARNPWASVLAVSMDRKALKESGRILLVAVARAENSGQVYNSTRKALKDPGHPPILMQGVEGAVSLSVDPSRHYRVLPLDESGREGKPLKTKMGEGEMNFNLSPMDHTSYYLVTAPAGGPGGQP